MKTTLKQKSIGIIGGMGPQAGLFAHELIIKESRLVWGSNQAKFPYRNSLNFTG